MRSIVILTLTLSTLATTSLAGDNDQNQQKTSDQKAIQGTWKIESLKIDGNAGPEIVVSMLKFIFEDDRLTITPNDPGEENYTFALDPSTEPASFDMTYADGKNKGETQSGIYSLEGDRLKLCFGKDEQRPKEFSAEADSGRALYILKREK